jgi:hypothetical protein
MWFTSTRPHSPSETILYENAVLNHNFLLCIVTQKTTIQCFANKICRLAPVFRTVVSCGYVALILATFTGFAAETARPFLHPDRIRYDRQCLTIEGQDIFIYSGAFHYFRCPKELWRDRFQKIKDSGFNTIDTYVPWNWSERKMPANVNDFSKVNLTDLDAFLKMAEEFGFYVIVRPGPYICAEWDTGGYPQWLLTKKPAGSPREKAWLRSDDPVYLAWCKHWYDAVCPVIVKHQITRKSPGKPGVILLQLENEYDNAGQPAAVMVNQIKTLGEAALAGGIDVPLFTCWTHPVRGSTDPLLRQIFDACNFYPRWNVEGELIPGIEKLRREQPDAPLATTELQGGWFAQVGGKLSEEQDGVTASQINNLTLFAIQNGQTILNYYMLFGGTNPDDWASRGLVTSYDYNAPIREWGGVGDRYQRVWAIGHMLQEHGVKLARAEAVECDVTGPQKDVTVAMRRAADGSRYFFVRTSQHTEPREGTAHVKAKNDSAPEIVFDYKLEPFGSTILYLPPDAKNGAQGEWLPKAAPAIERPTDLPPPVVITSARSHDDSGPSHWAKMKSGESLAQAGVYGSHFIFYRTKISRATATNLLVEYPDGDAVLALINGRPALRTGGTTISSVFALPAGSSDVRFLYENRGHAHTGPGALERASGISVAQLTGNTLVERRPIWKMHLVDGTSMRPEVNVDFDDTDWTAVAVDSEDANQLSPGQAAVFRARMELTAADLVGVKTILTFARIDDRGWVYVNGKNVGQTREWWQAYSFDVTKQLHTGHNVVAVVVKNSEDHGGIGRPAFSWQSEGAIMPLESFSIPTGDEKQWWTPGLNDKSWKPVTIGKASAPLQNNSVLTWYRMNFSLPSPQPGVWVPWRLHIVANGNGFLYLNGHSLGRYWEAGPQHDFFLPECWLHFGAGQTNNLTLSLRPLDNGAAIQSAAVEPYAAFAENGR